MQALKIPPNPPLRKGGTRNLAIFVAFLLVTRNFVMYKGGSLKDKFLPQSTALRTLISDLGRYAHFEDFWQACLTLMPLGKAMRLCYEQGVQIP